MMLKQTLVACFITVFLTPIFGQKPVKIKLKNPSFEGYAIPANTPINWYACNFKDESPPDTHGNTHWFGVEKKAFKGETYIGMVVRDNNTWEAIGQKLKKPLLKSIKYSFSIYACQSENYQSMSRSTGDTANYTVPAVLKIWGSDSSLCDRKQLLAQSQPIDFKDWKKLEFTLAPKADYKYFIIEAFYIKIFKNAYNGNILIDNASAIVPILDKN
jgi:hypothetical protein